MAGQKRSHEDSDSEEETPDEVRLWEDGFKDRSDGGQLRSGTGQGHLESRTGLGQSLSVVVRDQPI